MRLIGCELPPNGLLISEIDAVYYMVSSVFGFDTRHVQCTHCGYSHLDKDWFSIHPHRRHLCAGCGRNFRDTISSIGNPIRATQETLGCVGRDLRKRQKPFHFDSAIIQAAYRFGFQSRNHLVSEKPEEEGIHVQPTNERANSLILMIPSLPWR